MLLLHPAGNSRRDPRQGRTQHRTWRITGWILDRLSVPNGHAMLAERFGEDIARVKRDRAKQAS